MKLVKMRKGILALILSVIMAVTVILPVMAAPVDEINPDVQEEIALTDEGNMPEEELSPEEALIEEAALTEEEEAALDEQTEAAGELSLQEEAKPIIEEKDADTYLNFANGIAKGVYGWVKSADGSYYTLGSVENGNLLTKEIPGQMNRTKTVYIGVYNETQITNAEYQTMVIHVPAAYMNEDGTINYEGSVNGYTAATAPIIFENGCSGWNSGSIKEANAKYINAGFIHVSCGSRSRDAKDANGYQTGKAPAMVADLLAGVIQLRANADILPGNLDRIVSVGTSGAGQMSSILGAAGDMPEYYPYLYEYGANGITKNADGSYSSAYSDSIYAAQCYCPIADLENADLAYAWMHFDSGAAGVTGMNGKTTAFTAFDLALQEDEANAFVDYINGLGLKDGAGNVLTLESPRKGSYYDAVLQNMSDAFNAYAAGMTFPVQLKDRQGNVTATYNSMEEMIAGRYTNTADWLVKKADGTWQITDMAGFINGTSLLRNKAIPGFDTMDASAENNAFGYGTEGGVHYSALIGKILKDNYDRYKELEGFNKEYVDAYIKDTLEDGDRSAVINYQTNLMNATEILLGSDGLQAVNPAKHFRTRNGTADQHTSFTIAYNLCLAAQAFGSTADYSLVWDMGHGSEEGTTTSTFVDWVKEIVPLDTDIATTYSTKELNVKVDGKDKAVTEIIDSFVGCPTHVSNNDAYDDIDQLLSIYVPDNATASSPIMLYVNNSGWQANGFAQRTTVQNGKKYFSNKDSDQVGKALAKGYVIVSYGCRSRNDKADDYGRFVGHSPATVTDTKAVIRYLRNNAAALPAGDPEKIVVTGTSGGGALSVIIAASGNSSEYFESLYEIGAAGMEKNTDGTYASAINDDVFATIAYCPINDLREADAAYEFTYYETRQKLLKDVADGTVAGLDATNVFNQPLGQKSAKDDYIGYNFDAEEALAVSKQLADQYGEYVDSLGLKTDDGTALTKENLKDAIIGLLKAEIEESADEFGGTQLQADLAANMPAADGAVKFSSASAEWDTYKWLDIEVTGSGRQQKTVVNLDSFNYDNYLYYVARNKKLKVPYAFSNLGLGIAGQNEDSLYGTSAYSYSPYEFLAWNNDKTLLNGAGKDDTGLTWDEYMETAAGRQLALQLDMTSPIPYLTNKTAAGTEDSFGDSAPYWYVRHGMADRDTSFALQTVLRYAMTNDDTIKDANFEFAWLKSHSGNYDVNEAYNWLGEILGDLNVNEAKAAQTEAEAKQAEAEEAARVALEKQEAAEAAAKAAEKAADASAKEAAKAKAEAAAKAKEAADAKAVAEAKAKEAKAAQLKKGDKFVAGNNIYKVTNVKKKTAEFIGVVTAKTSVSIPAKAKAYNGTSYTVTSVGARALYKNTTVKKLTMGTKVTSIGKAAFYGCKKLKTITIKTSKLKKIGKKAVSGIYKKASIKVPKAKKKAYTKLLKKAGLPKKAKVK